MEKFKIKIADRVFSLATVYPDTKQMSLDYLCDEPSEFEIETDEKCIEFERMMSLRDQPGVEYERGYLETLAVYRKIAETLMKDNCILMHGAAVAVDDEVYIFTAKSGTGKTTHISLWQQQFGERFRVVNGDKPILRVKDDRVYAYGTPWCGKEGLNTKTALPVKAVCQLERGKENKIEEIGLRGILPVLLGQSYMPVGQKATGQILKFWTAQAKGISYYLLHCNMEPEAALVSYSGMNGNKYES